MAVLRDLLEGIEGELTPEKVERLIKRNAKAEGIKILLDDGDEDCYVPKSRLDKKIKELKDLEEKIGGDDATSTIEQLKKDKEDLETKITEYDKKIKFNTLSNHMKTLASEFKCQDTTGLDLLNFIDQSKIVYKDDGTVEGIKDQVEKLLDSKPYLFGAQGNPFGGANNANNGGASIADLLGGTGVPGNGNLGSSMNGGAKQDGILGQQLFDLGGNTEKKVDSDYYFK